MTDNYSGYALTQGYDGDTLRVKKTENGTTTYYLRSSVFGGQVVAEIGNFGGTWGWFRGYIQLGGQLLAVQQDAQVRWVHEDPVTKTKRMTDSSGAVISTIVFDPWGGAMGSPWSQNTREQRRRFTTYERDGNEQDEAMFRRYNHWLPGFIQPDPYDGSYDPTAPQSFNRYSYVQNDPVNFVDPSGLDGELVDLPEFTENPGFISPQLNGWQLTRNPTEDFINSTGIRTTIHQRRAMGDTDWLRFDGFGPFTFGQNRLPTPQPQPHPTPVPKPKPDCIPNGSADIGAEGITPVFGGPKGGVMLDSKGVYPYLGGAFGTPGKGLGVTGTLNKNMVSPGLSFGFSVNYIVGFAYSTGPIGHQQPSFRQALREGNFQFGGGTPGASVNATVVFNTPRVIRDIWPCK